MSNNFLQVFEDEIKTVWGDIESLAVDETKAVWNTFKGAFLAISPTQALNDLIPMFEHLFGDVVVHDYGDALVTIENYAEVKVIPWVKDANEHVLIAALAAWQVSKLSKVV